MNSLETQLHSWKPRRPSARLRRRLFGLSFAPGTAWIVGSLVPAAACAMLTLSFFGSHSGVSYVTDHELVASNWSEAAFVTDGFADKQNHLASITFDSTNRSGLGSTTDSFRH
jgi:hypothetical protein